MSWGGGWPQKGAHKYKARSVAKSGRAYASKLESSLHDYLINMERAGEIREIKQQVRVKLSAAEIVLIPDYSAVEVSTGQTVFYESKGFETPEWRIKRRLWLAYGPSRLYVFKGTYKCLKLKEVLTPKPS